MQSVPRTPVLLRRHSLFAAALLAGLSATHAANKTWDGGGTPDFNWLTGLNWDANVAPLAADSLFFAGTTGLTNTNDFAAGTAFAGLTFNAAAGAFVLGGNGITLTGNVVNSSSNLQTINLDLGLTALRTFTTSATGALRLGGVVSGAGGIVKTGAGTLTLANTANTFTGEINFGTGGIVNVASVSNYGVPSSIGARLQTQEVVAGSGIGLHFTGGTLQYTGSTAQSTNREIRILGSAAGVTNTIEASGTTPAATLSFTKTGANTNLFDTGGLRTLALAGTNTGNNSFSIQLTNQATNQTHLRKAGTGTWLIANSDNTYTGETIFAGGVLNVATLSDYGVPSSIGARTFAEENATSVTGIGLHFAGGTLQYTGSTPQSTNRNIRVLNNNGATFDASGSNPAATLSFTKTGANINLFDTGGARTFTLTGSNTGNNSFSIPLTNQDVNATSLLKTGLGTWVLNGPDTNSATGTTSVNGGTLVLAKTNAIAVSAGLTIGTGAVARLAGTGGNQIADSQSVTLAGTGALRLNGTNETVANLISPAGAGIVENESGVVGTSTLTVNSTVAQSFGGVLRDGDGLGTDGVLAFTKNGGGTLTLAGASSHSGATTVSGGTLTVTGSLGAGTTVSITNATVNGAGTIAGSVNVNGGGFLSSSGSVGGPVNIASGGTVASTGTISGAVNIASNGLLTGTSTISGLVTAAAGARISPGTATTPGTLAFTALNLTSGSVLNYELGATSDLITVSAADGLALNGGAFNIFDTGGVTPLTVNGSYTLLDYTTSFTGNLANLSIDNAVFGKLYDITEDGAATAIKVAVSDTPVTEWSGNVDGQWPNAGNWTAGVPNGVGAAALFGLTPSTATTVAVGGPKTVGGILFNNANSYTLAGGAADTITLDNDNAAATVAVTTGSHTITAPIALAVNANLTPAVGTTLTLAGDISGDKALTQTSGGTVILTGTNSYTRTNVNAGVLQAGTGGATGSIGSGDATVAAGAVLSFNRSDDFTLANNFFGGGAVTKDGPNIVTFTGASTITTLNLNSGTAKIGAANTLASTTVNIAAGTFDLNEINTTVGGLAGAGGIVTDNGAAATTTTLTVNQSTNTTFSGTIEEGAGQTVALTKAGAGTLTLDGTGGNTYAGLTTITDGSLTLAKTGVNAIAGNVQIGDAVGSDFLNLGASDQIADTSVLSFTAGLSGNSAFFHLNGFNETIQGITTTVGAAAVIANNHPTVASTLTINDQGIDYTYDGILRNGGVATLGLTKNGAGTLTLANTATVVTTSYTGTTTLNEGRLVLENLTAFNSPIVNNLTAVDSLVFNQMTRDGTATGIISGPGGVTKNGPNTLTLTGANTFTGPFILNGGTVGIDGVAGANNALGAGEIIINGGNLRASSAARALTNPVTVNASFILGRLTDLNGPITLNADATITASNPDGVANNNSILGPVGGGFRLTLAEGSGGAVAPFGLGTGALVVNAVNTNTGGTTIASGRVNVTGTGALANGPLTVTSGILNLGNTAQSVTSLNGTGGTVNLAAGHTLNVVQTGDTAFAGVLAGAGSLVKAGAGSLTLSGNSSTRTGPTSVNGGSLIVNNLMGGSAFTVNGATLGGGGTVGAVSSFGGTIAPGSGVGTLTTGALALDSTSIWRFELADPTVIGGGVNDLLTIGGSLTLDGILEVIPQPGFREGTYRLANYSGALTGPGLGLSSTFADAFPGSTIDTTTTPGQVNLNVVPEPGSILLLLTGLGTLVGMRRRRPLAS